MKTEARLLCPPVSAKDQEKIGIAFLRPGDDYAISHCSKCHCEIWIGPKQRIFRKHNPEVMVLCFLCCSEMVPEATIHNLGGGKGTMYIDKKGKIFGAEN